MESTGSKSVDASAATTQSALKPNSDDIGWEYGHLLNPSNNDKVQCNLCSKKFSGGVYRIKEHIARRTGNVSACKLSTSEDITKCLKALDDVKRRKKAKHDADNYLRAGVNIDGNHGVEGDESHETIDLDDCFGDLKEGRSFGPMDRFATLKRTKECSKQSKFASTVKGKEAYATVTSPAFWAGVTRCLNIFEPLFVVLRMVDADWKPSMGFIYGELQRAKKEIKAAVNNKENVYKPIMDIIATKSVTRLDTCLHLTAYILNPYYFYNNAEVRDDVDANDAIIDYVGEVFPGQDELHDIILNQELPIYRDKLGKFSRPIALKACMVNDDKFDPANWWETYGNSCPNLKKMAMRILSLTASSSGCERNWSMFEGVQSKRRNRLEPGKVSDLVFVEFNANLEEKNNKRKLRNREVLLADGGSGSAQEWITDGVDEHEPREIDDEFESENEVEDVEVQYESDGVEIIERHASARQDDGLDDL